MRQAPSPQVVHDLEKRLLRLTPPQALMLSYIALSCLGTLLLKIPGAAVEPLSWQQAIFTAVSASTVTGLALVDTGTHFSLFGQWVLLVLIQCGGLGLMAFGVFVIHLTRDRMTLSGRAALSESFNQSAQGDMRRLLPWMFGFTAAMEITGTVLLAFHWVPELGWSRGLYYSFFHAVSAFNNAGFSLAPDNLMAYVGNGLINSVISLLFILGGIGFVVVADVLRKRRFKHYTLHTKLMLVSTVVINALAMLAILLLEHGNPATLGGLSGWDEKLWAAWFQAITPRSAGFNTLDPGQLMPASALLIMVLMFIGGGSGSTASGIKLSTFVVMLLATRAFLLQQDRSRIFGRSLEPNTILKALAITIMSLFCVLTGVFALAITESAEFLTIAFEVFSAFSTVGLSRGLTPQLSDFGQVIIIILMLVGRIGPLTLAFTLANRHRSHIEYPAAPVNIG